MRSNQAPMRLIRIAFLLPVAVLILGCSTQEPNDRATTPPEIAEIPIRILAINDFHGNLATSSDSFGGVGRADFLAANIRNARDEVQNSVFVSAGDLIGGSPLISALFHDEPTIEAMNLMGLDFNGVGNHEFDEGLTELQRLQHGGPHPVDGDLDGDPFGGSDFKFLAANVIDNASGDTIFPPYAVRRYQGVGVAFIGMTLQATPNIVAKPAVEGMTFLDEVETINALVPSLREEGIEAIVVLFHHGGSSDGERNDCGTGLNGPVAEITARLDDAVDIVIAGHTNDEFICQIDGKWVTMADNRGRLFTVIDASLNTATGDLEVKEIENRPNSANDVVPDAALTALIDRYEILSADIADAVIGSITDDITRWPNSAGESALGDVIADAQLAATRSKDSGGAVVAFMNPGGIRENVLFDSEDAGADGELTYGEAFSVQPFGNSLVTLTMTGDQIDQLLEAQFRDSTNDDVRLLQVSNGFSYTWNASRPIGERVDPSTISIDGVPIDIEAMYRVTVNSYLADGGSGFSVLTEGTERTGGMIDLDALVSYFSANSPIEPGPQDRITRVD